MLSMIIPLVPPASGSAEVAIKPTFVQRTVPSIFTLPAVVDQTGMVPPEVPAVVTSSMLLLLSRIFLPLVYT